MLSKIQSKTLALTKYKTYIPYYILGGFCNIHFIMGTKSKNIVQLSNIKSFEHRNFLIG